MTLSRNEIDYYVEVAKVTSKRSRAVRLKVGAVLVSENKIMGIGYNGTPPGWDNACEVPDGSATKPEVIHAEMNCLFKFLNNGIPTKGSTMFLTHSPCLDCAKALFLANVSTVYYVEDYRSRDGVEFLLKANVRVIQHR